MLANCTLFSLKLISFSCYDHSQFNCITEILFFMCYMPVFDLDRPVGYFIWPVTKSKQKQNKVDWKMFVRDQLPYNDLASNHCDMFGAPAPNQ